MSGSEVTAEQKNAAPPPALHLLPVPGNTSRPNRHEIAPAILQYWSTKEALKSFDTHEDTVFWCKEMAEAGHAPAQYKLGKIYSRNQLVAEANLDEKERSKSAIFWYERAAAQGYAPAQCKLGTVYRLGQIYVEGHLVTSEELSEEDRDKIAVSWYKKAAAQSYASAYYGLGILYINNRVAGVPGVFDQADNLNSQSSMSYSISSLASMDSSTDGNKKMSIYHKVSGPSLIMGTRYLRKAAKQGHKAASRELARIKINCRTDAEACYHQAMGASNPSLRTVFYTNQYIVKAK